MAPRSPPVSDVALNLALALVAASTAPLLLLDSDLTVIAASTSFCKAFLLDSVAAPGTRAGRAGSGRMECAAVFRPAQSHRLGLCRNRRL